MDSARLKSFAGEISEETPIEQRSFIWTASLFEPVYFDTYPPVGYTDPVTLSATASFWEMGEGDPMLGYGHDNGAFDLVGAVGLRQPMVEIHEYEMLGVTALPTFGAELATDWSSPGTDDCNVEETCTCLLLGDESPDGRAGFYALVTGKSDANGDTSFNLAGTDPAGNGLPIILQPIPSPAILGDFMNDEFVLDIAKNGFELDIRVTVPDRLPGVYEAASGTGCSCGPVSYEIYYQIVTPTANWSPPDDRDPIAWTLADLDGGGMQEQTALGASITVQVDCPHDTPASSAPPVYLFLAARLYFDSGFSTPVLSANSAAINCPAGAVRAEPVSFQKGVIPPFDQRGLKKSQDPRNAGSPDAP